VSIKSIDIQKSQKKKDDSEMIKEINSLKQRVELLEKKLDKNG
jgi:seryl-tRNA synthetase